MLEFIKHENHANYLENSLWDHKKDKSNILSFLDFFFFLGTSIVVSGKPYNQSELPFFSPEEENQIIF